MRLFAQSHAHWSKCHDLRSHSNILLQATMAPHIQYTYVMSYTSQGIKIIYFPSDIGLPRAAIFWAENLLLFPNKAISLQMEH